MIAAAISLALRTSQSRTRCSPAGDARHGRPSAAAVAPFSELAVTRGLYWKFRTNDPARAARAGGLAPDHLRRTAGPTRVITTCSP
jgi:hypothetical protein